MPVIPMATPMSACLSAGRVVDAVPGHGHHLTALLQRADQPQLVLGRDASEDVDPGGQRSQGLVAGGRDLEPRHRDLVGAEQAELAADGLRRSRVIAGDHLHADSGLPAGRHCGDGLGARRIDHSHQTEQGEPALEVGRGEGVAGCVPPARRHRQHPHAPPGPGLDLFQDGAGVDRGAPGREGTAAQHHLGRSLQENPAGPVGPPVQRGHVPVLRLEGQDVETRRGAPERLGLQAGLSRRHHQRRLGGVAGHREPGAGLLHVGVVAERGGTEEVEGRGVRHHRHAAGEEPPLGRPAGPLHLERPGRCPERQHGHLVAGQGTGLVGADHRGGAERLHGRQLADDGVTRRHALHPDGECDGDDGRQSLRDGADRQRDGEDEHLAQGLAHGDALPHAAPGCRPPS